MDNYKKAKHGASDDFGCPTVLSMPRNFINSKLKSSLNDVIPGARRRGRRMDATANGDVPNNEDRRALHQESKKAVTSFVGMYILVAAIVSGSWLIGVFQFSYIWVFVCIAGLFVVWKAKISKIIAQHLSNEEATLYRKRAFRQDETAEWLNFLLNRWWVFSSSNIEELVKRRLDERLWDIRPSFVDSLELVTFSMGEQTPNFRNVRAFECSEGTPGSLQPISWFNVHRPPAGLDKHSTYQVVIEADVNASSEDFKMIFRGRVGSKRVNVGFDLAVEDMNLGGTIQAIIHLSMDIPFPHVSKATICFVERPDVTFNIKMLKALSMMEIPLLKSWIHNHVMEGLTKAMVDPASVDLVVKKAGPTLMGQSTTKKEKAQGVLTVHLKGSPPKDAGEDDVRYTVVSIGNRKRQTHEVPAPDEWEDVCSFFIYSLATERIKVKSKCMRLITSTTLEQREVNLSSFPFQVEPSCDTELEHKDGSKTKLKMQYTALPQIQLSDMETVNGPKLNDVAGVLYVCIHGASNVLVADKTGASDPYCVLFCNRRRVLTTPFIPRTRNPKWESWVEFFVADYSRSSLSFFVYDWDGTNAINDDFLGSVHVNMTESEPEIMKKSLTLGYNRPNEGFIADKQCGRITVSIIFRPVPSVARSEKFRDVMKNYKPDNYLYREDLMSPSSMPKARTFNFEDLKEDRTEAGLPGRKSTTAAYVEGLLSDKVIVELTILQGKDMMAMDRNGYSDPFCVVSLSGKKVYTTAVKKKTLFPKWNETFTTDITLSDDPTLIINVYDKDVISNDFMGKLSLTVEQLKELSIKDTSDWYTLERAKTGKIQLKCHVIAKDTLRSMSQDDTDEVFEADPETKHTSTDTIEKSRAPTPRSNTGPATVTAPTTNKYATLPTRYKKQSVRRSNSNLDQVDGETPNGDHKSPNSGFSRTPQSRRSFLGKHSESSNSINMMQRSFGDTTSVVKIKSRSYSSISVQDKMYSVTGKVQRLRGNFPSSCTDMYCKVRLELPGNRLNIFHNSRIIGKSEVVSLDERTPSLNINFEIDRGAGVPSDAMLIFDLKHSSKDHLATKSYSIRSLLADADNVCKWIPVGNGLELEVSLSQGQPSLQHHRKSGGSGSLLKSISFRKDKHSNE